MRQRLKTATQMQIIAITFGLTSLGVFALSGWIIYLIFTQVSAKSTVWLAGGLAVFLLLGGGMCANIAVYAWRGLARELRK